MPVASSDVHHVRLVEAVLAGDSDTLRRLLRTDNNHLGHVRDTRGWSLLDLAASNGHLEIVKQLRAIGVDVNDTNQYGNTPLFYACKNGHFKVVKYLLEQSAAIDVCNKLGMTPLSIACRKGCLDIVRLLWNGGANIDILAADGSSAFFVACESGFVDIVKYLIEKRANIYVKNKQGKTVFDVSNSAQVKQLLIAYKAKLDLEATKSAEENTGLYCPNCKFRLPDPDLELDSNGHAIRKVCDGCTVLRDTLAAVQTKEAQDEMAIRDLEDSLKITEDLLLEANSVSPRLILTLLLNRLASAAVDSDTVKRLVLLQKSVSTECQDIWIGSMQGVVILLRLAVALAGENVTDDALRRNGSTAILKIFQQLCETGANICRFIRGLGCQSTLEALLTNIESSTDSDLIQRFRETFKSLSDASIEQGRESSLHSLDKELSGVIGMSKLKQQLRQYALTVGGNGNATAVLLGKPGPRTCDAVEKAITSVLYDSGLIRKRHSTRCHASQLQGRYVGESDRKIRQVLSSSRGGVLFIDELYQLNRVKHDVRCPEEVVKVLCSTLVSIQNDSPIVIFTGGEDAWDAFIHRHESLHMLIQHRLNYDLFNVCDVSFWFLRAVLERSYQPTAGLEFEIDSLLQSSLTQDVLNSLTESALNSLVDFAVEEAGLRVQDFDWVMSESDAEETQCISATDVTNAVARFQQSLAPPVGEVESTPELELESWSLNPRRAWCPKTDSSKSSFVPVVPAAQQHGSPEAYDSSSELLWAKRTHNTDFNVGSTGTLHISNLSASIEGDDDIRYRPFALLIVDGSSPVQTEDLNRDSNVLVNQDIKLTVTRSSAPNLAVEVWHGDQNSKQFIGRVITSLAEPIREPGREVDVQKTLENGSGNVQALSASISFSMVWRTDAEGCKG